MSPTVVGDTNPPQKSDATKAWHHLLRSTFESLPKDLRKSREHRIALRRLIRRHG